MRHRNPRISALALAALAFFAFLTVTSSIPAEGAPASTYGALYLSQAEFPVADAGDNRTAIQGALVQLNASRSTDDLGIVNYTWTFDDNGTKTLYGVIVYYRFFTPGAYIATLNVTDGEGLWDTDNVTVTINPDFLPPRSVPGRNRSVYVNSLVVLNGSNSRDNGYIANYTWNFTYDEDEVVLYGLQTSFWFNKTGTYVIWLTVTDSGGFSSSANLTLKVKRMPTWLDNHWLGVLIWGTIGGIAAYWTISKLRRDRTLITKTDIDKMRLAAARSRKLWRLFITTWMGKVGISIIVFFLFIVVLAQVAYPDNPQTSKVLYAPDWWADLFIDSGNTSDSVGIKTTDKILGTDQRGRDVLLRTMQGTKASLIIGFTAMAISMGIGTIVGLGSGYWGGWRDEVIMRVNDVFLSIPWLVLMIVIAAIWGAQNLASVIIVIGVTGWSTTARIVRAQVLSLKTRMFVERSKAVGAGDWHIIGRHIFPNVVPLIFANAILTIAISILSESTLSFLGLGPQDVETWGRVLEDAYNQGVALIPAQSLFLIVPGLCIVFVVLGFTFIGYAMDEVLNPKLRKR